MPAGRKRQKSVRPSHAIQLWRFMSSGGVSRAARCTMGMAMPSEIPCQQPRQGDKGRLEPVGSPVALSAGLSMSQNLRPVPTLP
jgi:hypothetical protein